MRNLRRLLPLPMLAVSVGVVAAAAAFGDSGESAPIAARASGSGLNRFGVLDRPAATALPSGLVHSVPGQFNLDLSRAREAMPSAGSEQPWYVVPGPEELCFFDGDGWACNSIANAEDGYLFTVLIPRQSSDGAPPPDDDVITIEGVVPDGVTSVGVTTGTGAESVVPVVNNTYVANAATVKKLSFAGGSAPAPIPLHP